MEEMALMVTVLGMDLEAAEMDQEMEGEEMEVDQEMVVDRGKEEEERVDQVDRGDQEVPQEEWEELEVLEVWEGWEAADLTAIAPGMVLEAAMGTTIGRERNLEEAEKEKL